MDLGSERVADHDLGSVRMESSMLSLLNDSGSGIWEQRSGKSGPQSRRPAKCCF